MAEETKTRSEVVAENIEAVETKHGSEAWNQIMTTCLKDISISLAMLVDSNE